MGLARSIRVPNPIYSRWSALRTAHATASGLLLVSLFFLFRRRVPRVPVRRHCASMGEYVERIRTRSQDRLRSSDRERPGDR